MTIAQIILNPTRKAIDRPVQPNVWTRLVIRSPPSAQESKGLSLLPPHFSQPPLPFLASLLLPTLTPPDCSLLPEISNLHSHARHLSFLEAVYDKRPSLCPSKTSRPSVSLRHSTPRDKRVWVQDTRDRMMGSSTFEAHSRNPILSLIVPQSHLILCTLFGGVELRLTRAPHRPLRRS